MRHFRLTQYPADMDPNDIADMLSRLMSQPYVTQEVKFSIQDCIGSGS